MASKTTVTVGGRKCKPFLLRVMVFSPESGYKFEIEVQLACTAENEEVWKLLFHLYKQKNNQFIEIISVEFVAGDPNEIAKVSEISDQGLTRPQVRAFRDSVFPAVKGTEGHQPTAEQQKKIHDKVKDAISH
jgi:hypothetical protein